MRIQIVILGFKRLTNLTMWSIRSLQTQSQTINCYPPKIDFNTVKTPLTRTLKGGRGDSKRRYQKCKEWLSLGKKNKLPVIIRCPYAAGVPLSGVRLYINLLSFGQNGNLQSLFSHRQQCILFTPQNFAKPLFSISPGYYSRPKRNRRQWLCKIVGG